MFFFLLFSFILLSGCDSTAAVAVKDVGIGFVIFSQENHYHYNLTVEKENDIQNQAKNLNITKLKVFKSHESFKDSVGHWTVFPLLNELSKLKDFSWIFFLEDITAVNVKLLIDVISKYDKQPEASFIGYALKDDDPTIIHHFAEVNEYSILYPHFSAGFFIGFPLLLKLASQLPLDKEYSFSIDPKYELAKFIWNDGLGTQLAHEPNLCLKRRKNCATWITKEFPDCGNDVASKSIFVAVKTCHKFHNDRITVVQNTWAPDVENLHIFSDKEDASVPTIKVDIQNVPSGHCAKTLYILSYYIINNIPFEWLVVVDDDTLINFQRLKKLLSCYDAAEPVALGERYGYGVANNLGYDYITGGGGMIFSNPTVKMLVNNCQCPSIDSPDDMIIGMCLKRLNIPATHSPHFHQGRPNDYSKDFLQPLKHVSFHKHWMIDPYSVYKKWLKEENSAVHHHTEL